MNELPHAQGPEKSVLSSIFKSPEKLDEAGHLTTDHFYLPAHRRIFEEIQTLAAKNQDIELISFVQRLHDAGSLDDCGGPGSVSDIYTYAPNHAHFAGHLRILTEKLALRRSITLCRDVESAVAEGQTPEEVVELAAVRSTTLSETLCEAREVKDTKSLLRAAARRWEDLATGREDASGMQTSLAEINARFRGLKPGRITVISGLPSQGKSLLGGQLLIDCVGDGHKGLFLTWEMSEDELMDRFIAYLSRLPGDAITDPCKFAREIEGNASGNVTVETKTRIANAYRKAAEIPLFVQAMHGQSITSAISAIRREHRKAPLKVVAMDFVQRIPCARGMEKQSYERQLTDIADRFQNLAQELGFHGILLSQLNKEGGAKHAEAINESCSLHLKILEKYKLGNDGTPVPDENNKPIITVNGIYVVKDRFHGQTGELIDIILDRSVQRFIPKPPNQTNQ